VLAVVFSVRDFNVFVRGGGLQIHMNRGGLRNLGPCTSEEVLAGLLL